jgi:hypothetical protein
MKSHRSIARAAGGGWQAARELNRAQPPHSSRRSGSIARRGLKRGCVRRTRRGRRHALRRPGNRRPQETLVHKVSEDLRSWHVGALGYRPRHPQGPPRRDTDEDRKHPTGGTRRPCPGAWSVRAPSSPAVTRPFRAPDSARCHARATPAGPDVDRLTGVGRCRQPSRRRSDAEGRAWRDGVALYAARPKRRAPDCRSSSTPRRRHAQYLRAGALEATI